MNKEELYAIWMGYKKPKNLYEKIFYKIWNYLIPKSPSYTTFVFTKYDKNSFLNILKENFEGSDTDER